MGLRAGCAVIALLALFAVPAEAGVRVQRLFDWRNGLPTSYTDQMEQDPDGFLWIVSMGGVVRYDGTEYRLLSGPLTRLVPGSVRLGRPLFYTAGNAGGRVVRPDGTPETGPAGGELLADAAIMTEDGALWIVIAGALRRRGENGWSEPVRAPEGTFNRGPFFASDRAIYLATDRNVYRAGPDGSLTLLAALSGAAYVIDGWEGTVLVGRWLVDGGHIVAVENGVAREIEHSPFRRLIAMAMRGDVLWIAYDAHLIRVTRDGTSERIEPKQGFVGGGAVFVDRENSLWIAAPLGLTQYPEPESVSWQDTFSGVGRTLVPGPNGFFYSSWSGGLEAVRTPAGYTFTPRPESHVNPVCVAPDGSRWGTFPGGFHHFGEPGQPNRRVEIGHPSLGENCVEDADRRLWFPTSDGLWALDRGAAAPRRIPGASGYVRTATLAPDGSVWFARASTVCRPDRGSWSCETVDPRAEILTLMWMPSGDLWAGTQGGGAWRRRNGRWEPIAGSHAFSTQSVSRIAPSPAGGVWVVGEGVVARVEERPDDPEGWDVVERIGLWQGLPTSSVYDILEDDDGTLWMSTALSLVKIPPAARFARPSPPHVVPVEVSVDGSALDPAREIELPYRRNRLELRFAALSFREPGLLRYRARLRSGEAWSPPSAESSFRFADLAAGRYEIQVEASLDGARWSASAAPVRVHVLLPWWRTGWFYLACALAATAGLTAAYRVRIGQLLRLERQRTRIAMDLHDAIGSGLGSIRILAGLAERESTPDGTRAQISSRIALVADELAQSLGDIVWSLRPGTATLASLGAQLAARASPFLVGRDIAFDVEPADPWPDTPLSLAVRRHVFLIGLEALHNAARHAQARRVVLALDRDGRRWRLRVEDDGKGMAPAGASPGRRGLGLESIARRAAEIGAEVSWVPRPGGGTVFTLIFDGTAEDKRTLSSPPSHERATGAEGAEVTHSPREEVSR